MILPETRPVFSKLESKEGQWVLDGLPYASIDDPFLARSFVRPDITRPFAKLAALLIDNRRINLNLVGGTEHPGVSGIRGPGVIPPSEQSSLVFTMNGGFQGPHGYYGMYDDGRTFRQLTKGFASLAISQDGTVSIGEWGRTIFWNDEFVSVRQNAVLLVEDGEITPNAQGKDATNNNLWGYVAVSSAEFITWRSAIGLTENGDLIVAAGNSLSAETLAKGMQAIGARTAMQLDINTPYTQISLFQPRPNNTIRAFLLMDTMVDKNAARYLNLRPSTRDFFYGTSK